MNTAQVRFGRLILPREINPSEDTGLMLNVRAFERMEGVLDRIVPLPIWYRAVRYAIDHDVELDFRETRPDGFTHIQTNKPPVTR